jgi:hypothetical protein
MHRTTKVVMAAGAGLWLAGSAVAEDATFRKAGASAAVQKRASAQCWKLAQKTRLTDEQATQNLVAGYLIGGIVGVMIVSSTNEEANKDPKSQFRRQVHDDCMAKRGYRKVE